MQNDFRGPIILIPAFKEAIWGGTKLRDEWGKIPPTPMDNIAETWEFSTHPNGLSLVGSGAWQGKLLRDYLQAATPAVLGRVYRSTSLPILAKYLDAASSLSVQVHPGDRYAREHHCGSGKTEMWYIVDAAPDAYIYYGFERPVTAEELARRIDEETLVEVLHRQPVKKGEHYLIPSGTVHAMGPGCLAAEIQQSCDTTYRVYDFGRRDKNGQLRELHVEQAKAVACLTPAAASKQYPLERVTGGSTLETLADRPELTVQRLQLTDQAIIPVDELFALLMVVDGGPVQVKTAFGEIALQRGQSGFVPADSGDCLLSGQATVLISTCRDPEITCPVTMGG